MQAPILVTGSHYSGSTWVGKMLSFSPNVGYIHEPFNPEFNIGRSHFNYWYTYVCKKNEAEFKEIIHDCLQFKYHTLEEIMSIKSAKDIARVVRNYINFTKYKLQNRRPLVKDPISLFSAAWMQTTFNMVVIVLIRHPAAFIGSLKKKESEFPFEHLLNQPLLINEYLEKFKDQIQSYAKKPPDLIDQGILLWNIFHSVILKYQNEKVPNWVFRRHEDLSRDPIREFRIIYHELGLEYSPSIENSIEQFSRSGHNQKNKFKLNSKANIWTWRNRLSSDEILRVREQTKEIASNFYSDEDW